MNKKLFLVIISLSLLMSCAKDIELPIPIGEVKVKVSKPIDFENSSLSNVKIVFKNLETGALITSDSLSNDGGFIAKMYLGVYDMTATATLGYYENGIYSEANLNFKQENIEVTKQAMLKDGKDENSVKLEKEVSFVYKKSNRGFLISEIFFTSTLTPEGKQYFGTPDQYFIITNNSDETLYADGIAVVESTFMSISKEDYKPNVIADSMAVQAVYRIPGTGKTYPVKPGESITIVDRAIDHRTINANSFDLSKADFEWFDESPIARVQDTDNPNVPNLEKYYCYTRTIWGLHNRGFHSYAIAKIDEDKATYLKNNKYDYSYLFVFKDFKKEMKRSSYKIANSWILDAVNLSIESKFEWIPIDTKLDAGWTYCGKVDSDKSRYGKAVRRKMIEVDGKNIYQDTNNSTDDFDAEVVPSLSK